MALANYRRPKHEFQVGLIHDNQILYFLRSSHSISPQIVPHRLSQGSSIIELGKGQKDARPRIFSQGVLVVSANQGMVTTDNRRLTSCKPHSMLDHDRAKNNKE